jgi:hypothetical protein
MQHAARFRQSAAVGLLASLDSRLEGGEFVSKNDGWVLFLVLESFLLLRALGYAGEPWWARWTPCFVLPGLLVVVSGEPSDLWSSMVLLLGVASLVAHAIWAHTFEAHWSIVDAARRGALIKTVTNRGPSAGRPPGQQGPRGF